MVTIFCTKPGTIAQRSPDQEKIHRCLILGWLSATDIHLYASTHLDQVNNFNVQRNCCHLLIIIIMANQQNHYHRHHHQVAGNHLIPSKLSAGLPDPRAPTETSPAVDVFQLSKGFFHV